MMLDNKEKEIRSQAKDEGISHEELDRIMEKLDAKFGEAFRELAEGPVSEEAHE